MMAHTLNYLAIDMGAESGRAIVGRFDGKRLELEEVHRFANCSVRLPDGLHWDTLRMWIEIKQGIGLAARKTEGQLASLGIDTWGVDFGLLDRDGALIFNPYHYRDSRTEGMLEAAFQRVPRQRIFEYTGIQFLELNSLYQLLSMAINCSPALDVAKTFLLTPDLFNYWLTGSKVSEFSIATTSQCFDPRRNDWAKPMLEQLGIPTHIFPPVIEPGSVLGPLAPWVTDDLDVKGLQVVAPACHDTGSAVVGVPAKAPWFGWISSGTWSIVGAELAEPIINDKSLAYNFTNEGGMNHTFRFCRNIMGLWLVQECRRTWARQGEDLSYAQLTAMAAEAQPLRSIVDPDCHEFLRPGDMPSRIRAYCQRTGQPVPENKGEIVRSALDGIALKYRWVMEHCEEMLGQRLDPIHIVGGGTQNQLLSQLAANALHREVVTGPVEATATGNIIAQAMAMGHLASLEDGRQMVRDSFPLCSFEPDGQAGWDDAYGRLLKLMEMDACLKD